MKVCIVNGTNRIGNKTIQISNQVAKLVSLLGHTVNVIDLEDFTELFRGEFLNRDSTKGLSEFSDADFVYFVVPVYHHALPGSLKNFFDLLDENLYDNKIFSFIASGRRDLAARDALKIVDAIIGYKKLRAITLSRIEIIDYDDIDSARLQSFLDYTLTFQKYVQFRKS